MITKQPILTDDQIQKAFECLTAEADVEDGRLWLRNINKCLRSIEQSILLSPIVQDLLLKAEAVVASTALSEGLSTEQGEMGQVIQVNISAIKELQEAINQLRGI